MDTSDSANVTSHVYNEDLTEKRSWKFCDRHISRSLVVFLTQVIIGAFMIVFSCVNIFVSTRCEDTTIWIAVLSSAVGYFLPNPRI